MRRSTVIINVLYTYDVCLPSHVEKTINTRFDTMCLAKNGNLSILIPSIIHPILQLNNTDTHSSCFGQFLFAKFFVAG